MSISSPTEARQGVLAALISLPLATGVAGLALLMTGFML